jgi:hypothetical protein
VALVRTDVSEDRIVSMISVLQLLVTANVIPSSLILFALMMEEIRFSETSVLTIVTLYTSKKTEFYIVTAVKTSNLT